MRVFVDAQIAPIKSGIEARSAVIKLAGHGKNRDEAIDCLQRGILAWCRGLQAADVLENVLRARGLRVETTGQEAILVDISVA